MYKPIPFKKGMLRIWRSSGYDLEIDFCLGDFDFCFVLEGNEISIYENIGFEPDKDLVVYHNGEQINE